MQIAFNESDEMQMKLISGEFHISAVALKAQ